jgi:hypothetical protein
MPNCTLHLHSSSGAGVVFASHKFLGSNEMHGFLELLGGAFGGGVGGILPDRVDAPVHPRHRSMANAIIPVAAAAAFWANGLDTWQSHLCLLADRHAWVQAVSSDPLVRAWHAFLESVLRVLAGFIAGFGAGYLTHLAFDFGTPRCLPLIG